MLLSEAPGQKERIVSTLLELDHNFFPKKVNLSRRLHKVMKQMT
jgi:hypothetical protein